MNYGKIMGIFRRKTHLKNVENIKLSEGKIEVNYFKSILKNIMEICGHVEFSPKSNYAWRWNDITVGMIADLLSAPADKAAKLRAEIIQPPVSRNTIKSYLADLLECKLEEIDETAPIRSMTLPVCDYQPKSYLTTLAWLEKTFGFKTPPEIINQGSIKDLLDLFLL